ncbi:MAG: hypothetical protein U0401_20750 [Anaerolineae bacterium]
MNTGYGYAYGGLDDPLAALLLCRVDRVDLSVINGKSSFATANSLIAGFSQTDRPP